MEIATFPQINNTPLTLTLDEQNVVPICKALSSPTRQKIIKILAMEQMDVSKIASILKQTEANVSAQIKILEKVNLVTSHYEPGGHGVRKICELVHRGITINFD